MRSLLSSGFCDWNRPSKTPTNGAPEYHHHVDESQFPHRGDICYDAQREEVHGCAEIKHAASAGEHHKYELVFIIFVKLVVLVLVFFVEFAAACSSYTGSSLTAASARAATSGRADDRSPACRGDTFNVNTTVPSPRQL